MLSMIRTSLRNVEFCCRCAVMRGDKDAYDVAAQVRTELLECHKDLVGYTPTVKELMHND